MPAANEKPPKYGRHKTGQARVVLNGQSIYLGKYGSDESWREYERVISEWRSNNRRVPGIVASRNGLTVAELILLYMQHVTSYYVKNERPTSEQANIKQALRPIVRSHSHTPAAEFSPLSLKAVRQAMIDLGWSRKYINDNVSRIKQMFKWAVENELVAATVYHALQAVVGLRRGRSDAKEPEPVGPVDDKVVEAIRPYVSRQVWAMIQLQRLTGMRPGEVVIMRRCDIEMEKGLWEYRPSSHKAEHHARERIVSLGSRSQKIIAEFLKTEASMPLFSPADAENERRKTAQARRQTPLSCGNRPQNTRCSGHKRKFRDSYTVDCYRQAIERACKRAFPPPHGLAEDHIKQWHQTHRWHPHQLRHSAGTQIRKTMGLEAAQVLLGHSKANVTQVYAERDLGLAREVAERFG